MTKVRYATVPGRATALMAHAQRPAHMSPAQADDKKTKQASGARIPPRARPGGREGSAARGELPRKALDLRPPRAALDDSYRRAQWFVVAHGVSDGLSTRSKPPIRLVLVSLELE